MKIYDAQDLGERIPPGYDGVRLPLDGKLNADLNWNHAKKVAKDYVSQGLKILWDVDLGLFANLTLPLSDQTQYLALGLSVEHFRDSIWEEFYEQTIGLTVYRGMADFSLKFFWSDDQKANLQEWLKKGFNDVDTFQQEIGIAVGSFEKIDHRILYLNQKGSHLVRLFCRDVAAEYLDLLLSRLPEELQNIIFLDGGGLHDALHVVQLLSSESFPRIQRAVRNAAFLHTEFQWNADISKCDEPPVTIGICLPGIEMCRPSQYENLSELLNALIQKGSHFRVIPESMLTSEWDGLDSIFAVPYGVSAQGKRKLQGFVAAGGCIVSLQPHIPLGLSEISVEEWSKYYGKVY